MTVAKYTGQMHLKGLFRILVILCEASCVLKLVCKYRNDK